MKKHKKRALGGKRQGGRTEDQPKTGAASPGAPFDPMAIPEEREAEENRRAPRPAPAPGVPVSPEQYEWLKKKAKAVRKPPSKHSQHDPSGKK